MLYIPPRHATTTPRPASTSGIHFTKVRVMPSWSPNAPAAKSFMDSKGLGVRTAKVKASTKSKPTTVIRLIVNLFKRSPYRGFEPP